MTQKSRFVNKRINSTETREGSHWARQIAELAYAIEGAGYIAGGAARWYIMDTDAPSPSDIDVFCWREDAKPDVESAMRALGYRFWMPQGSAEAWTRYSYIVEPDSVEHQIADDQDFTVQIVPPRGEHNEQQRFGSPADVLGDFTFRTEQFAVYADGATRPLRQVFTYDAINDTKYKRIRFNKIVSPIYATWRISKYSRKGFRVSIGESQRLFAAWDALPLDTRGHMIAVDPFGGDVYRELGGIG